MQVNSGGEDVWVPVGLDSQVAPASSNPVFVQERSLAMWRGEVRADGSLPPVNVWDDKCPHRGMRLSHGFVKGDTLCCIYHGWGYQSEDGQCVHIPAHPDLKPPKTICAKTFKAASRYGIVWTNLAETPAAPLSAAGAESDWVPVRSVYVRKSRPAVEAFLKQYAFGEHVQAREPEAGIWLVDLPEATLMLALQEVNAQKTGIHAVAAGEDLDKTQRLALSARLASLRDALDAFDDDAIPGEEPCR